MNIIKKFHIFNENVTDVTIDLSVGSYNIVYRDKLPDYLFNIRDTAVNYWNDTIKVFHYQKQVLDESVILFTTQKFISKKFIDSMNDDIYKKSDIILVEDFSDNLWIMDGHHRLFYDRSRGNISNVFIIPKNDIVEIDEIWYSNKD
jgi:hypothetical protein